MKDFEKAVLEGNDWARQRPWILVIEATLPTSQTESHAEWEGLFLNTVHVYSDGLNRYYLAKEHADLSIAFKYPPNVFDGYVTASRRLDQAERNVVELLRRIELAEAAAVAARTRELRAQARASTEAAELRQAVFALDELLAEARRHVGALSQERQELLASTSWRVTAPFRKVASSIPRGLWRHARRAAKAVWWAITPSAAT